jgi:hypothetical protein
MGKLTIKMDIEQQVVHSVSFLENEMKGKL